MVGSDPEKYKHSPRKPSFRRSGKPACAYEWKNTAWSWDEMLKKHLRAADQPKVDVKVEYEENKKYAIQEQVLRHMGLLEAFAAHAADRYAWPKPWSIEARSCGQANATWKQRT